MYYRFLKSTKNLQFNPGLEYFNYNFWIEIVIIIWNIKMELNLAHSI